MLAARRCGRRTELEKCRFDYLEKAVSEKAYPGQVDN